jgi:hypothetical protein
MKSSKTKIIFNKKKKLKISKKSSKTIFNKNINKKKN